MLSSDVTCSLSPEGEEVCVLNEILKTAIAASQAEDTEPVFLAKCKHLQIRSDVKQDFQNQLPSAPELDQLANHTPPTTFPDLSQDRLPKFLCSIKMALLSPSQYCLFLSNPEAL